MNRIQSVVFFGAAALICMWAVVSMYGIADAWRADRAYSAVLYATEAPGRADDRCIYAETAARAWAEVGSSANYRKWKGTAAIDCLIASNQR